MKKAWLTALLTAIMAVTVFGGGRQSGATGVREVENLDRGLAAIKTADGVFVSWRRLGTEPADTSFLLYRDGKEAASGAITNYVDTEGTLNSTYIVVTNKKTMSKPVSVWKDQFLDIVLADAPVLNADPVSDKSGVWLPEYAPGDASIGDLDGDGEYEIIMLWNPGDAKDSATRGFTGKVYIDAYKLDSTFLWRIDLGKNIRAGAHDTQLLVADFNGDGKAELIVRTADGAVSGTGEIIGDPNADWAALDNGKNLKGPLYLTAFEGATGKIIDTVDYDPQTGDANFWGDDYGNRSERYLGTIAWLDGVRPSAILQRGYYPGRSPETPGRTVIAAYSLEKGKLVKKWRFDTTDPGNEIHIGSGNHSMAAGDLDGDGRDDIISGALALGSDGKVLWNTGYGHGDAHHLGEFDPRNPGYEYMKVYEAAKAAPGFLGARDQTFGLTVQDAKTGKILLSRDGTRDTGRGMIGNIGYKDSYYVTWAAAATGYWDSNGEDAGDLALPINGRIYWDGGLSDQLQDHVTLSRWNDAAGKAEVMFTGDGLSINGTKGNVNLQADILGDWREEFVTYAVLSSKEEQVPVTIQNETGPEETTAKKTTSKYALRLYTTVIPTAYNFSTFMHDALYRIGAATYNITYNQPPHISFYLSDTIPGYTTQDTPKVKLVPNNYTEARFTKRSLAASGRK
ncbi:rhamnogalacturonan endolyase YesW [Spirochaetia bacterium]|nr:rhamnogalacturonan endolyase YesW [Spirochaetia bacterium]